MIDTLFSLSQLNASRKQSTVAIKNSCPPPIKTFTLQTYDERGRDAAVEHCHCARAAGRQGEGEGGRAAQLPPRHAAADLPGGAQPRVSLPHVQEPRATRIRSCCTSLNRSVIERINIYIKLLTLKY